MACLGIHVRLQPNDVIDISPPPVGQGHNVLGVHDFRDNGRASGQDANQPR
jgi:hypothetical protein